MQSGYASMAQLVEQRIRNAQVVGSSPTTSFISVIQNRWQAKKPDFSGFLRIWNLKFYLQNRR